MTRLLRVVQFPFRHRQEAAMSERQFVTKESFVAGLSKGPFESQAANLLWDLLVEAAVIEDFRPLPDDDFLKLYGLAEEDLDEDIVLAILQRLGIRPTKREIEAAGPINTPRDIIKLITSVRGRSD